MYKNNYIKYATKNIVTFAGQNKLFFVIYKTFPKRKLLIKITIFPLETSSM